MGNHNIKIKGKVELAENSEQGETSGIMMDLPDEIVQLIISYLPVKQTITTVRRLSKRFNTLVNENHFWRLKCLNSGVSLKLADCRDYIVLYLAAKHGGNLLRNPNAAENLLHWDIESEDDEFCVEKRPIGSQPFPAPLLNKVQGSVKTWVTSYNRGCKSQWIDVHNVIEPYFYYKSKFNISISEWYTSRFDCGCAYDIKVELFDKSKDILDTFSFFENLPPGHEWKEVKYTFSKYYPALRYIKYTHGGSDLNYWAGYYGVKITGSDLHLLFSPK